MCLLIGYLFPQDINERYVVFNNEGSREEQERQVQQLLRLVHQMVLESPRQVFSCPLLRECEKDITYMRNRLRMLEPRYVCAISFRFAITVL